MKVVASVFDRNAKCHKCQNKFQLKRRRQCIICSKYYTENLFCKNCSIKETNSPFGFLAPKRYCTDCYHASSVPKSKPKEEEKAPERGQIILAKSQNLPKPSDSPRTAPIVSKSQAHGRVSQSKPRKVSPPEEDTSTTATTLSEEERQISNPESDSVPLRIEGEAEYQEELALASSKSAEYSLPSKANVIFT